MSATLLASAPAYASPDAPADAAPISRRARIAGRVLSGLAVLFLTFDASIKFFVTPEAVEATRQLGWQPHHFPIIGTLAVVCLLFYLVPRTAVLGAVLWTGYLGGAIATHVRVDNPLFSHVLFPIYVAAFIWGGLYLRDPRVRALLRPAR
jgi:hypothetical protein